jgi:hypothetical protein
MAKLLCDARHAAAIFQNRHFPGKRNGYFYTAFIAGAA